MSMHDVEDYAQEAVIFVNSCDISGDEKVSLIKAVYEWHDEHDTGFTKLREYDILVNTGYFHLFDMEDHPDYSKYAAFFESIRGSSFEYIYDDPVKGYAEDNPLNSYWLGQTYREEEYVDLGKMCCEAGGRVWKHLLNDKREPEEMSAFAMLRRLAELAAEKDDSYTLSNIYIMTVYAFWYGIEGEDIRHYERLKELVLKDVVMEEVDDSGLGDCDDYDDGDIDIKEWVKYYSDWRVRHREADPGAELTGAEVLKYFNEYTRAMESGDIKTALEAADAVGNAGGYYKVYANAVKAKPMLDIFKLADKSKFRNEYASTGAGSVEEGSYRNFLESYQEWLKRKEDVLYYVQSAQILLNEQEYGQARSFIDAGQELDKDNDWLKLYRVCVTVFAPVLDRKEKVEKELPVLESLLESDFKGKTYARYLKASIYNILGKGDEALELMKEVAEEDEIYKPYYEHLKNK